MASGVWGLSRVCSSWRSIILDTPSFWNNIHIDLTYCVPAYSTTILSTVITRTKSTDLDITFFSDWANCESDNRFDCMSRQLFELLCSFSYRWRSFEATIPTSHWDCFRQVEDTLLKLESLSIDIVGPTYEFEQSRLGRTCTFFSAAPKLRLVNLGNSDYPPLMPLSTAAPELSIKLHPLFKAHLSKVIPGTVNKLTLLSPRSNLDTPRVSTVITPLPSIVSLDAEDLTFSNVTLPNLHRLHLIDWCFEEERIQELERFIRRSGLNKSKDHHLSELYVSVNAPSTSPAQARLFFAPFSFLGYLELKISLLCGMFYITTLAEVTKGLLNELILPSNNQIKPSLPWLFTLKIDFSDRSCAETRDRVHKVVSSRTQLPDWLISSGRARKLQRFSYTDRQHESLTLSNFDNLLLLTED